MLRISKFAFYLLFGAILIAAVINIYDKRENLGANLHKTAGDFLTTLRQISAAKIMEIGENINGMPDLSSDERQQFLNDMLD